MKALVMDNRWTILFSLLCVLGFQSFLPVAQHYMQANMAVVAMQGEVVSKTPEFVDIKITGEKLRSCGFIRMSAMTTIHGVSKDAFLDRVDGRPITNATKPVGLFDLGIWRVYPVEGSTHAMVFVQHDCDGTVVVTKIAEVQL